MFRTSIIGLSAACIVASSFSQAADSPFIDAIKEGEASLSFRYRFADIDQDGTEGAQANTVRTRLGYQTQNFHKFSSFIQYEQIAELIDVDYSDGITDRGTARIADPEVAELNQLYIQYQNDTFKARLGRQIYTLDNRRFIGSAPWRQNERSYDGVSLAYAPNKVVTLNYAYFDNDNPPSGINQEINDHIANAKFKFNEAAVLTVYGYFLETVRATDIQNDTVGLSLTGKSNGLTYRVEFAEQEGNTYETSYFIAQGTYKLGDFGVTLGYDSLGGDGANGQFQTPRANRHGPQGWADLFLNTPVGGVEDTYLKLSYKQNKLSTMLAYHDFQSEDDSVGAGDLGTEIDAIVSYDFSVAKLTAKYADYSADNFASDTRKFWLIGEISF